MEGIVANVFDRKEGKCDGALMQERGVADTASAAVSSETPLSLRLAGRIYTINEEIENYAESNTGSDGHHYRKAW